MTADGLKPLGSEPKRLHLLRIGKAHSHQAAEWIGNDAPLGSESIAQAQGRKVVRNWVREYTLSGLRESLLSTTIGSLRQCGIADEDAG